MRSLLFFAAASVFSCSSSSSSDAPLASATERSADVPSSTSSPAGTAKTKGVVIATVMTHDARVSILSGQRVVVRKHDGVLVADGITIDQLRATDPLLHALVTSAVASNGTYLDASR